MNSLIEIITANGPVMLNANQIVSATPSGKKTLIVTAIKGVSYYAAIEYEAFKKQLKVSLIG